MRKQTMVALTTLALAGTTLSACSWEETFADNMGDHILMRADTDSTRALRMAGALVILSHYAAHTPDSKQKAVLLHKQIRTISQGIGELLYTAEKGGFYNTEMHYKVQQMTDLASMVVPKTEVPKLENVSGDPLRMTATMLRILRNMVKIGEAVKSGHIDLVNLQIKVLAEGKRDPAFAADAKPDDQGRKPADYDADIKVRAAGLMGWGDVKAKEDLLKEFNASTKAGYNIQVSADFFKPAFRSIEKACLTWGSVVDDGQPINCQAAQAAFDCAYNGPSSDQCKVRSFGK